MVGVTKTPMLDQFNPLDLKLAILVLSVLARREDFSGARTALSACSSFAGVFARTKLSVLRWLREIPRGLGLRQSPGALGTPTA
jgi:hypothetical protein